MAESRTVLLGRHSNRLARAGNVALKGATYFEQESEKQKMILTWRPWWLGGKWRDAQRLDRASISSAGASPSYELDNKRGVVVA